MQRSDAWKAQAFRYHAGDSIVRLHYPASTMNQKERQERAIALTLQSHRTADPSNGFVRSELPDVFGGTLLTVTWHSGKDNRPIDSFVFFEGDREHFFFNSTDLARFLETRTPRNTSTDLMREVFSVVGAPAILAIVITFTICYLAIIDRTAEPPKVLSLALTTILGFYFGSKTTKPDSAPESPRKAKGA